jgi:hypothetical protein
MHNNRKIQHVGRQVQAWKTSDKQVGPACDRQRLEPSERQVGKATQSVAGDKWGQKWGNKWGYKWQQVGDKLTPHGPKHPEWEASGRQVKITWPKAPRVGRQVKVKVTWPRAPKQVGDKWETSLVSHRPRNSNIYIYMLFLQIVKIIYCIYN